MTDNFEPFPVSFMLAIGEARQQGAEAERERIIALIKSKCDGRHSVLDNCECPHLVALIKGDNN